VTPTIYLLRHGETAFNVEGRLQGSEVDSPLTGRGVAQARTCGFILRKALTGRPPPRFVASPLGRAQTTMRIVRQELGLPEAGFDTDNALREVDIGAAAGLTLVEVAARFPGDNALVTTRGWETAPLGGESDAQLWRRVSEWLASVREDTVAVSHRTVGRFIRAQVQKLDRAALAALDEPHDCVFSIRDGNIDRLTV